MQPAAALRDPGPIDPVEASRVRRLRRPDDPARDSSPNPDGRGSELVVDSLGPPQTLGAIGPLVDLVSVAVERAHDPAPGLDVDRRPEHGLDPTANVDVAAQAVFDDGRRVVLLG